MATELNNPFPYFSDRRGDALDQGYIYIGAAYQDPELFPIDLFWDDELTIPAVQPLRTIAGYVVNPDAGNSPADIYFAEAIYSIRVLDRLEAQVFYEENATDGLSEFSGDHSRYYSGGEYLSTFRKLLTLGTGANIVMSGDSTTAGAAITDPGYIPDVLLKGIGLDYGADYQVFFNRGQAGARTDDWLTTYLAGDLTAVSGGPGNLLIVRWGVNDPDTEMAGGPFTVDQTVENIRTGLATIRATHTVDQLSILLMAPNAAIGRGRTKPFFREVSQALVDVAREYGCAYFNTFAFAQDALENIGQGWDNAFGDGTAAIHPLEPLNGAIYAAVGEILYGGLGPWKSNHLWNRGASGTLLTAATLPAAYEYGIMMDYAQISQGFPVDGYVVTYKNRATDTNALQMLWSNSGVQFRVGGAVWLGWQVLSGGSALVTPGTGMTLPASERMQFYLGGERVTGRGYVAVTVPALLTAGQAIGTVPAGFRPIAPEWGVDLEIFDGSKTPTFETIKGNISAAGVITTRTASTYTAARVYINATWAVAAML